MRVTGCEHEAKTGCVERSENALFAAHACEPLIDQALGLAHDPVDQFPDAGNIVDEAGDHSAAPCAGLHVAIEHHFRIDARDLLVDVGDCQRIALFMFDFQQSLHTRIVEHTLGVAQATHDETRVEFGGSDDRLLNVFVYRRLLRRNEPCGWRIHDQAAIGI